MLASALAAIALASSSTWTGVNLKADTHPPTPVCHMTEDTTYYDNGTQTQIVTRKCYSSVRRRGLSAR